MRFGGRPIRSSGLSVSERKMAPLVCHQWQKCADSLTAEAGLACCGPSKNYAAGITCLAHGQRGSFYKSRWLFIYLFTYTSCTLALSKTFPLLNIHFHGFWQHSPLNYTGTWDKSLFKSFTSATVTYDKRALPKEICMETCTVWLLCEIISLIYFSVEQRQVKLYPHLSNACLG